MYDIARVFSIVAGVSASLFVFGFLAVKGGSLGILVLFEMILAVYGIALFGFLHYRATRQEELRNVLTMAAESQSPLADAVWAYVNDRPRGLFRRFCEGTVANLLCMGSYWSWHKRHRFDYKAALLAAHLEAGVPLSQALWMVRGAASRETILAAAVGESTGDLVRPLKHISETRIASVVVAVLPRLVYPAFILLVQVALISFVMIFIIPKFEKILTDLRVPFPPFVEGAIRSARWITPIGGPIVVLIVLSLLWIGPMLVISPTFRWHFPGVSFIERRFTQGRLLKMLGMLLAAGKTVPQAVALLRQDEYLGRPVQRKLDAVQTSIEAGEPLADRLAAQGLMPRNMVPLLHAAERVRNLPWALEEAGDTLSRRARLILERFSTVVGPLAVALLGVVVAIVALCIFMPLIAILTELTGP